MHTPLNMTRRAYTLPNDRPKPPAKISRGAFLCVPCRTRASTAARKSNMTCRLTTVVNRCTLQFSVLESQYFPVFLSAPRAFTFSFRGPRLYEFLAFEGIRMALGALECFKDKISFPSSAAAAARAYHIGNFSARQNDLRRDSPRNFLQVFVFHFFRIHASKLLS